MNGCGEGAPNCHTLATLFRRCLWGGWLAPKILPAKCLESSVRKLDQQEHVIIGRKRKRCCPGFSQSKSFVVAVGDDYCSRHIVGARRDTCQVTQKPLLVRTNRKAGRSGPRECASSPSKARISCPKSLGLRAANFQIQNRPFERQLSGLRNAVAKPALLDVKLTPHSL
jgi:hypothetical protein